MKIEQRRGGWFVYPENPEDKKASGLDGFSGPWYCEKAAKLASEGKFTEAHAAHLSVN